MQKTVVVDVEGTPPHPVCLDGRRLVEAFLSETCEAANVVRSACAITCPQTR